MFKAAAEGVDVLRLDIGKLAFATAWGVDVFRVAAVGADVFKTEA